MPHRWVPIQLLDSSHSAGFFGHKVKILPGCTYVFKLKAVYTFGCARGTEVEVHSNEVKAELPEVFF